MRERWLMKGALAALLVGGCLPPPIVVTFQGTPTPVLLSKVDRVGGQPIAEPPPPITTFSGNVRSELVTKTTTVTETTTTTGNPSAGTGSNGGNSGGKGTGYNTGVTAGNNSSKYTSPTRTTSAPPPAKVTQNDYVYGAGALHQQGPNLLTYYALSAVYSKDRNQGKPTPPNPKDVDIYLKSFRVRSLLLTYTDTDTSQSDPETTGNQTSTTTTTESERTVYKVNGARIRAVVTPKR